MATAKKIVVTSLKVAGTGVGLALLSFAAFHLFVEVRWSRKRETKPVALLVTATPARLARGKALVSMRCVDCHYDQQTGALSGRELTMYGTAFGRLFSHNLTKDARALPRYTDGEIAYLLRTGIRRDGVFTGTFMIMPQLSDEDLISIIAFLRSDDPWVAPHAAPDRAVQPSFLLKRLLAVTWQPAPLPDAPIPTPALSDAVAYGRYLVAVGDCYGCHSKTKGPLDQRRPEDNAGYLGGGVWMMDAASRFLASANLTMDATGLGAWTEDEFVAAMRTGIRKDGKALRYPMVTYTELGDAELRAIFAYLRTVPPIVNDVPRNWDRALARASNEGEKLYIKYACASCHGDTGIGVCDLRHASEHYPTDAQLTAFVRDASRFVPGTKMPTWDGVIPEADYPALIAHVHALERR